MLRSAVAPLAADLAELKCEVISWRSATKHHIGHREKIFAALGVTVKDSDDFGICDYTPGELELIMSIKADLAAAVKVVEAARRRLGVWTRHTYDELVAAFAAFDASKRQ